MDQQGAQAAAGNSGEFQQTPVSRVGGSVAGKVFLDWTIGAEPAKFELPTPETLDRWYAGEIEAQHEFMDTGVRRYIAELVCGGRMPYAGQRSGELDGWVYTFTMAGGLVVHSQRARVIAAQCGRSGFTVLPSIGLVLLATATVSTGLLLDGTTLNAVADALNAGGRICIAFGILGKLCQALTPPTTAKA
jgi:hypothetical protein